jgi:hypothetical protein
MPVFSTSGAIVVTRLRALVRSGAEMASAMCNEMDGAAEERADERGGREAHRLAAFKRSPSSSPHCPCL